MSTSESTAAASPLRAYLQQIEAAYRRGNATEHTYRSDLKQLIETLDPRATATNEPRRVACGAPDFIITQGQTPLGYIETKDIGIALDKVERSDQMRRYLGSLGNLILTDYLEFRWYVAGQPRLQARLAKAGAKGRWQADSDGISEVSNLLRGFMIADIPTIASPKELATRMAAIAQLMRDAIAKAFNSEDGGGELHNQMLGFRRVLLPDLSAEQFADMYAQSICYGLFAARCNVPASANFTREHAAFDIPKTNPFLRKMFGHIAGPDLDDRVVWAVDDLAAVLNRADMETILRDFGHRTRQEDPVVHFYETFLAAYDPKMREARGVYYTPEPVVSYIVRSVDHLLKSDFNLPDGLADAARITITSKDAEGNEQRRETHKVQILDPATGTGTFLHSIIDHIYETFKGNQGMWSGYVSQHLLPRLFGFELLMAPYAVAHMKLGLQLKETGYDFRGSERLGVYLTNTLEGGFAGGDALFAEWLVEEATAAGGVKYNAPVMVVIGNPPYSYESTNTSPWISSLVRDYYKVDGQPLKERNPKGLQDDYVKFIRFAQWRIQETGYGVLAYISNHRYLTNPTFPGMRQSLMNTFDDIYLLNLHGSTKPKEIPPADILDQNVFDIQQGVAIGIFVKRSQDKKQNSTVYYADLWGSRDAKYAWLASQDISTTGWQKLNPRTPFYYFVPQNKDLSEEYESGWKITEMMPVNSVGFYTARDGLAIQETKTELQTVLRDFVSLPVEDARQKYKLGADSRDWQVGLAQKDVLSSKLRESYIQPVAYRPFDTRFTYYTGISRGLICMPRSEVMQNMIDGDNLAICFMRNSREQIVSNFYAVRYIADKTILSSADNANAAPLYLYPDPTKKNTLFDADIPSTAPGGRRPNLAPAFIADMSAKLDMQFVADGGGDLQTTFGPEDVFDYLYAVFHSPAYRARYAEFLKIDFPRLPLTTDADLFRALCGLGQRLVALHVMEAFGAALPSFPERGNNMVEKIEYRVTPRDTRVGATLAVALPSDEPERGRVYINAAQYFDGVPPRVWEFHVGGYQVCHKWLKDRKGRVLSYEDINHYRRVVAALAETITLMEQIDAAIEEHGGWPLV
ncbi:MAG: type ISP restriction/modification enzyme [Ktedonobacteraceae bacterium]